MTQAHHPWRAPWSASPAAAGPRPQRFLTKGQEAMEQAVRRMAAVGHSPETIAMATRLSVEQVLGILEGVR